MWEYTDKVKDHFLNPRNVGVIKDADGVGEVGSLACGDALTLYFKLDEKGRIAEARFQTFGCASAIASSSALTEMIKGKTLEEAQQITNDDVASFLGGLPKEKMHCSVMGFDALKKAIANYRGEKLPVHEGTIVCECFDVSDLEIKKAVQDHHLATIEEVTNFTKAGGGCGKCHEKIQEIINETLLLHKVGPHKTKKLSNIQKIKLIEQTLEDVIRPALKKDHGDIELVDVSGNIVTVKLLGTCALCSKSPVTLKNFVESKLKELVSHDILLEEVKE
ncbi:MAG TPA: Fe-S cluster assembly protein NifU [bacterium]|nr:Fe-S cluster assembly protein NifU [bacterium]